MPGVRQPYFGRGLKTRRLYGKEENNEREIQGKRGKVLGDDEGGRQRPFLPQVKGLKRRMIAGQAIPGFDFFIQWHLTERCNLRCRHCYQERGARTEPDQTGGGELRPEEVRRELDGAAEMIAAWRREYGIEINASVHFTGGEPLLYDGLWETLAHARKLGFSTALLTNGTLVSPGDARTARELGVSDIQVSMEGTPALHDSIRGRGSYGRARRGIGLLADEGCRVSLNVTLSRLNFESIGETIEAAGGSGANSIYFSRLVPCGAGEGLSSALLSASELYSAFAEIKYFRDNSRNGFHVGCGDPLFQVMVSESALPQENLTASGCSAGFSGITIDSTGKVMPCRRTGVIAGDLKEQSLREIWASSPVLEKLRARESYAGKCGRCRYWPLCRGCRAVALHYSGRGGGLFADDPQCWVQFPSN